MNVLSHVETVTDDDGGYRRTERSERHDYLYLGIAIRSEAILELNLPDGQTIAAHLQRHRGTIVAPS